VLDELRLEMTQAAFNTWLGRTRLLDLLQADEATVWRIGVPTAYARDWLEARLRSTVERVVQQLHPDKEPRLEFVVSAASDVSPRR
jgi:chromosomal replication initiation ATPase DnaA